MKNYQITYTVKGTEVISPLFANVIAKDVDDAKRQFLCSGKFYNTNNPNKVVIISIRII